MHQDIAEPCEGGKAPGKRSIQDIQFTDTNDSLMGVYRLFCFFQGNDPVADIYATLGCHFQITFHDISQVGICIEFRPALFPQGL